MCMCNFDFFSPASLFPCFVCSLSFIFLLQPLSLPLTHSLTLSLPLFVQASRPDPDRRRAQEAEEEAPAVAANEALKAELEEAMAVIKSLKGTINEVNLLNAKLLYANKLFRGYNLTNEQKVKVVENLDRTTSVREVKLVYATLAESMKFTGTERKVAAKKTMTEGFASKPQATTAPKKEIISESNELANRFKQLAGIIK